MRFATKTLLLLLCFCASLSLAAPNLEEMRQLVETIAAYIRAGNYDAALEIANAPGVAQLLGSSMNHTTVQIDAKMATKIAQATDFDRFLYAGSWLPFGLSHGYAQPFARMLVSVGETKERKFSHTTRIVTHENGDETRTHSTKIPCGIIVNDGLGHVARLEQVPWIPAVRVQELKRILSLVAFEEIYHAWDTESLLQTKRSANPIVRQFFVNHPTLRLNHNEQMEISVYLAMYYQYQILSNPRLREFFLSLHSERQSLRPDGVLGPAMAIAAKQVEASNQWYAPTVSDDTLKALNISSPLPPTASPRPCEGLYLELAK